MELTLKVIRNLHIVAGFVGLAAFWVPIFARKGASTHVLFGRIFKYSAYLVLAAAGTSVALRIGSAVVDGIGPRDAPQSFAFIVFLGYLTWVTFSALRHGMQVLQNKPAMTRMDTLVNRLMAYSCVAASVFLIVYALYYKPPNSLLLFALSPIGYGTGMGILKAIRGKRPERKVWFYEHMGAMLGCGIAFHTAFAVFGSTRLFDLGFTGWVSVIPWVAPAAIGIPAAFFWTRYYQRKFNDLPQ